MELDNMTAAELMQLISHEETCEMFIEMREVINSLSNQFERLFVYAKSLELEKATLIKQLENR